MGSKREIAKAVEADRRDNLDKLIRKLLRYQPCLQPDMAIVDRQALDEAIAELRTIWVHLPTERTDNG